jgi:polyadenylation factor subunit 2
VGSYISKVLVLGFGNTPSIEYCSNYSIMSFGGRGGGGRGGGGGDGGGRHHNNVTNSNQEAEDAEQKAAERNLLRKCVDYHVPAVIDIENRLYYKASQTNHARHFLPYLQPHSSALRLMGMPISNVVSDPINSNAFCTFLAHVTRAKNSTPIMCLSWTPGGRRLLTGNQDGEFTLWDGITFGFELIMSAHDTSFRAMEWYVLYCFVWLHYWWLPVSHRIAT